VDVGAIEDGDGDALLGAGDGRAGAAALPDGIAVVAARTPVQIVITVMSSCCGGIEPITRLGGRD
jgi:hypothetical protein